MSGRVIPHQGQGSNHRDKIYHLNAVVFLNSRIKQFKPFPDSRKKIYVDHKQVVSHHSNTPLTGMTRVSSAPIPSMTI